MVIRTAAVLAACGFLTASLSACAVMPEAPVVLEPDVPLPPQRPHLGRVRLGHRDGTAGPARRVLFRPKVLKVRPSAALRPTLQAAEPPSPEPRSPEPPAVPSHSAPPPGPTGSPRAKWGSAIPGSVPVLPKGWELPP